MLATIGRARSIFRNIATRPTALTQQHREIAGANQFRRQIALIMGQKAQLWWDLPAADCFLLLQEIYQIPEDRFRATLAAMLFVLGSVRGAGYIALGAFNRDAMIACAFALPLMMLGAFLGDRIHTNLDQPMFRRFIAVLLIVSGIPLLLV